MLEHELIFGSWFYGELYGDLKQGSSRRKCQFLGKGDLIPLHLCCSVSPALRRLASSCCILISVRVAIRHMFNEFFRALTLDYGMSYMNFFTYSSIKILTDTEQSSRSAITYYRFSSVSILETFHDPFALQDSTWR